MFKAYYRLSLKHSGTVATFIRLPHTLLFSGLSVDYVALPHVIKTVKNECCECVCICTIAATVTYNIALILR